MEINWNKFNFKIGDRVLVDADQRNGSEVVIIAFTPNKMFSTVRADDGYQWETMTRRLSPIVDHIKQSV